MSEYVHHGCNCKLLLPVPLQHALSPSDIGQALVAAIATTTPTVVHAGCTSFCLTKTNFRLIDLFTSVTDLYACMTTTTMHTYTHRHLYTGHHHLHADMVIYAFRGASSEKLTLRGMKRKELLFAKYMTIL